ncbi:MAG TPA: serine hydrolase [bacterium]|nr:serine hydrolase [bacterium]
MADQLRRRLRGIVSRLDGTMGVYVHAFATGETIAINADQPFQMASVFKIPILAELLSQVDAGRRSLDDRITLADDLKSPGSGVLKELSAGTSLTLRDLATLMIIVSDNTATDILLGLVTKDAVNARLRACGLERTAVAMSCRQLLYNLVGMDGAPDTPETRRTALDRLRRREIDPDCRVYRDPGTNMTTPREMGRLLEAVVAPTLNGGGGGNGPLSETVCRGMLDIMRRQQVRDRLPLLLPASVEIAHKTGSVSRVSNDAAILYAPKSTCVVTVFTRDLSDDLKGRMAIGQVGRAVYDAYTA